MTCNSDSATFSGIFSNTYESSKWSDKLASRKCRVGECMAAEKDDVLDDCGECRKPSEKGFPGLFLPLEVGAPVEEEMEAEGKRAG